MEIGMKLKAVPAPVTIMGAAKSDQKWPPTGARAARAIPVPISAMPSMSTGLTPILVASLVTGLLAYLPSVVLILILSHYIYGMPVPERLLSLLCILSIGLMAFRGLGLVIASVVNSMQESQLLVQLIYLPMLFLSGATFPLAMFPPWLLVVTQFVPATHMVTGIQGMLLRNEGIAANIQPMLALAVTGFVGLFISYKLFRWEKEEKIR